MKKRMSEKTVLTKLKELEADKVRNKKRFEMLDNKTIKKVLDLNEFFNKYVITYRDSYNRAYFYYDTPQKDLEKSGISLFKGIEDGRCTLTMARSSVEGQDKILERLNGRYYTTKIGINENVTKKMEFLINSFKEMFATSVYFDPEFLLNKLQMCYEIHTQTLEYRLFNGVGLKIKMLFDTDHYINHYTKRSNNAYMLTLYQLSDAKTDEAYFDMVGKLERYCKELSQSSEHKTTILHAKTKELPKVDKEEVKKQKKKEKETTW